MSMFSLWAWFVSIHSFNLTWRGMKIGAGIQIPPNAARVLQHFGLEQAVRDNGGVQVQSNNLKRYQDGRLLCSRRGGDKMIKDFGSPWLCVSNSASVLLR